MAISETVLILAGGTAVLSILFGIRLAMWAGPLRRLNLTWRGIAHGRQSRK